MSKLASVIDLAVCAFAKYCEASRPRPPVRLAGMVLCGFAMLMLLTAVGFGLAATYHALTVLGPALACLLTGAGALAVALLAMIVSYLIVKLS